MPNLVEITDFTGELAIPQDKFTSSKFSVVRNARQFEMLYDIMGAELATLFIADLDSSGVPQTARFTNLYDAFVEDDNNAVVRSLGIKEMVKRLVYFYYVRENNKIVTLNGNKSNEGENSKINFTIDWFINKYNEAIETAKAIQWYIEENLDTYPEENRQLINYNSIF